MRGRKSRKRQLHLETPLPGCRCSSSWLGCAPAGSCSSSDSQTMPLHRPPSHPFPPLFSLFPNPLLPSLFRFERSALSPHCCVSLLCPLHLVPFPVPSLSFVLPLSPSCLSVSPPPTHSHTPSFPFSLLPSLLSWTFWY